MVRPVINHKEATRKATRDDMEVHEATPIRYIPSTRLPTDFVQPI